MSRFRVGFTVLVLLMLLTLIEYWVALVIDQNLLWLIAISISKAALILVYFMHLGDLFWTSPHPEGEEQP